MNRSLWILCAVLILTAAGCSRKEASDSAAVADNAALQPAGTDAAENDPSDDQDRMFFKKAAEGGMAEVEAGTLAQQKASSKDVKEFAEMMVTEHTKANEKLKDIAAKHAVKLPGSVNADHKAMKMRLAGLSGKDFDREYIRGQIKDHEATLELLRTQSEAGRNADAKAFASETLPIVQAHLQKAQELGGKLDVNPKSVE